MKLDRMKRVLLVTIVIFYIAACGSISVSNRGAKVTVESKPKQPNVIVNGNVTDNVNENVNDNLSENGKKKG
ncbi:hypothetical protein [Colwellia sp. PAMC 21821]|uniref:hypothetical protein n=1 Tax=Colwellia sp. PAMC 21821 TaxID=1816219 RepID=UPI0009BD3E85|nr:hypothetical protein [Colwellia sp. PAMC 21821]ARD44061.1 hypothetical protein A3Q33_06870 [Colwellia sp. PAMC 21821]